MHQLQFLEPAEAANATVKEIQHELQLKLSELFETKHLYQRVKIDASAISAKYIDRVAITYKPNATSLVRKYTKGDVVLIPETHALPAQSVYYILKNIKLYCTSCQQREVFSCIFSHDLNQVNPFTRQSITELYPREKGYQGLLIAYQCQRCKGDPTLFLVRRENWTFVLEGRSPIEEVEIPSEIPRTERGFFRDSIVAFQSGKSLPAILYLRVFIESFCRRMTETTTRETGEELTTRYNKLLPSSQSSQMPSLKDWYAKLSEAIHDGREDSALYVDAKAEIVRHFEFRRLFRIKDETGAGE